MSAPLRVAAPVLLLAVAAFALLRPDAAPGSQDADPPDTSGEPALAPDTAGASGAAEAAAPPAQELAGLSYEREFFYYEPAGRRDPFEPLLDVDVSLAAPRFDELALTGVFLGEGGGMVVVEDADRKGYFLRQGESLGRATLVQILPDQATFDVRDFGISRRESLKLQRPEETP